MASSSTSSTSVDVARAAPSTLVLQNKVTHLAGLFARAVHETSKAVEDTVENTYSAGGAVMERGVGGGTHTGAQIKLADLNPIDAKRLELTTEVNTQIAEIRALIAGLPGIESTTEQLLKQLEEEEARNKQAGERLLEAQAEAKKWLAFVEDAENKCYVERR